MRWKHSQKLWPDRSFQLLWIRLLVKLKLVSGYYMMFNCDQKVLGLHRIKKTTKQHMTRLTSIQLDLESPWHHADIIRNYLAGSFAAALFWGCSPLTATPPAKGMIEGTRLFPLIQPAQMCDVVTCYVFCVIFNINILFVKIALFKSIFFLLKMINEAKMRFETTAIYN